MRKIIPLPSLSRVVAGAKATLECPVGPTYYRIVFDASGTGLAIADIGRIDVLLDGKVVMTFKDLQRLMDINSYYNRATDSVNQFALHFFRAEMMDIIYRRAPGIGTKDVQTFHIEIQLAGTAPADIAIDAVAYVDPVPQNLGVFVKVREFPYSSAVSGQVEIDKLPRGPYYAAIHCFKSDISHIEVEADQVKIVDADKGDLERNQKEASPVQRVPVTGSATHIDWWLEGDAAEAIKTSDIRDFRVKTTLTTPGAVDFVTETLDILSPGG